MFAYLYIFIGPFAASFWFVFNLFKYFLPNKKVVFSRIRTWILEYEATTAHGSHGCFSRTRKIKNGSKVLIMFTFSFSIKLPKLPF